MGQMHFLLLNQGIDNMEGIGGYSSGEMKVKVIGCGL